MGMEQEVKRGRWRDKEREMERSDEGVEKKERVMPFETFALLLHFFSLLQDSWQSQRGRAERGKKERELKGGRSAIIILNGQCCR